MDELSNNVLSVMDERKREKAEARRHFENAIRDAFLRLNDDSFDATNNAKDGEESPERRREECERRARRGEMDPRLEFTFQLLIDVTGLPRHAVMDHVFEGNMLDEINQLFLAHARNKLLWYHQEDDSDTASGSEPKLFLSDGWDVPLTGTCIYMFRINTGKQLPEEGFHKDLLCGMINAKSVGLVRSIQRVMEHVFMAALARAAPDPDDDAARDPAVRQHLLPALRSFCSALRVCEEASAAGSSLTGGITVRGPQEMKEISRDPAKVASLEITLRDWIKSISEVLSESSQLRREADASGPQDELEYWKKRAAQFSQLVARLQEDNVQQTLACLTQAGSKAVMSWRDTERQITFCYNEAKDNAKFIGAMEKCCHALYLEEPSKVKESVLSLLQTVRLVRAVSQHYNTDERISALMVKITNQMIEACRQHITRGGTHTVWTDSRPEVRGRLKSCLSLHSAYRSAYKELRLQTFLPDAPTFSFSENYVFGKFDSFCDRLRDILALFDLMDDYNDLFERRMEGLLLGEDLEEAAARFKTAVKAVSGITEEKNAENATNEIEWLDPRCAEAKAAAAAFRNETEELRRQVADTIERNFADVWDTPLGANYLARFEKVGRRLSLPALGDKCALVLRYWEREVDMLVKMCRRQRDDPPLPRHFPPLAGRAWWARWATNRLMEACDRLEQLDAGGGDALKRAKTAIQSLQQYTQQLSRLWRNQNVCDADEWLQRSLLAVSAAGRAHAQFPHEAALVSREAALLCALGVSPPPLALALLSVSQRLAAAGDHLKDLVSRYEESLRKVRRELRPLLLGQAARAAASLRPALDLTWADGDEPRIKFLEEAHAALDELNVLITRVHDAHSRLSATLASMNDVILLAPPDEAPWTLEEFTENIENSCLRAGSELHRRSTSAREAAEELLQLVKRSPAASEHPNLSPDLAFLAEQDEEEITSAEPAGVESGECTAISECFDNSGCLLVSSPHPAAVSLPRAAQALLKRAPLDLRRQWEKKAADALVKVTKRAILLLVHQFVDANINQEHDGCATFMLELVLVIPSVQIAPSLEKLQTALTNAGRALVGVARAVAHWPAPNQRVQWKKLAKRNSRQVMAVVNKLDQTNGAPTTTAAGARNSRAAPSTIRKRTEHYRLRSEEKPAFPLQQNNFYGFVVENKEIVKALSQLAACTQHIKPNMDRAVRRWDPYHFLWRNEARPRALLGWCLEQFEMALRTLADLRSSLAAEPDRLRPARAVLLDARKLKLALITETDGGSQRLGMAMRKKYAREAEYVGALCSDLARKLERNARDLDDVRALMDTLRRVRDHEADMELRLDPLEEAFAAMTRHGVSVSAAELERVDALRDGWRKLLGRARDTHLLLLELQPRLSSDLASGLEGFRRDAAVYCSEYRRAGPMQSGLSPRDASDRLLLFQNRFDGLWRRLQTYQSGEELFGLPPSDYPELAQIRKELNLLQKLYKLYNDVIDRVSSYYDIPWGEVNIEEINNELMEFQNRCRKLPKGLKEWPAFFALKKTIDDFNDMCPLLELMANKAMKPRHWQRIMEVTQYTFRLESDDFCLRNILEAPLLQNKEDIEDICISAMKEKDIEAKLRSVTSEWSIHELTFQTFDGRGELLLRGDTTAETIAQLEDSLMVLASLLSNRYNAPFRKQIQQWLCDLQSTNEILERWLAVQNMWVYLEAVFVGGDIAKQLPKEAKRFARIDKSWQKIMQRAHETPGAVACCAGDELLRALLPHLQEQLELCQRSLSGYLEKKRTLFPRFFFVSDPALLEILGQASDSHTIQNHLLSIFDNVRYVRFHDIEYNKMVGVISAEGEEVRLERGVRAEGSVESWLGALLAGSRSALHAIIRGTAAALHDLATHPLPILEKAPAQVGLLAIQLLWTRDGEAALSVARRDRRAMPEANDRFLDLLNTLIDQTTRDLTKLERTKFETLITIHVHQRDIFDTLCRMGVRSATDFEWLKQCRFYFKEEEDRTRVVVTDVTFIYQNEYLGCTERLVITPLTDRCYITLAQALAMSSGGAPCGPAGTGKTETVKDMGKTLAQYVVIFNCSDQMDYRGLGRIYKGLAQAGAWGCFDEFNRIELPVLSVAAQQVAVVLQAKKEKKKEFVFTDGDLSPLCPEFGIFITMNPGYAGRKELPENLKVQFRTVAMMVPDRQIIIRVKLASCGFLENITLARKFYTLYKLCEEQLTKQVHYDFGLRNILSVLRRLGAVKRESAATGKMEPESTVVMRVLRDMNLSKLIDEDEPLFISLVADLFPAQPLEKTQYPELEEAVAVQVEDSKLVFHPPWVLKVVQLYETQRVRHGIMALGPAGAGKTACMHTLMKALTATGTPHREMRMNPKSITAAQMFGRLDVATNDWTDGIFSALWRKTLRLKSDDHIWLVLDGPVDSIWIENLNSVLDDNKTLTLANGDRLAMSPTSKIIFEPENIDNASPATVSRNGMVYMSSSGLDWDPVVSAWTASRNANESEILKSQFAETFPTATAWCAQHVRWRMATLPAALVAQALVLLTGLLEPVIVDEEEVTPTTPTHLKRLYSFALAWSLGALLETDDRIRFDKYLRDTHSATLDLPPSKTGTLFDWYVTVNGDWAQWEDLVASSAMPDGSTPDYSTILVPIVDNVRIDYLINCVAKQKRAVLLLGEQGSAKTVMIKAYMKKADPEQWIGRWFNFSSATSPYQFQKTIESYVEKRSGTTYGPAGGRKMLVFVDDVSLPQINEWGDQITCEILRQTMTCGGFYSLEKPGEFTAIVDVHFLGAMPHPGGGRNEIPMRLKRQFCSFNCPMPGDGAVDKIFRVIAEGHYNHRRGFPSDVKSLVKKIVPLTRQVWQATRNALLPTPANFHYVFSLRELSRIWQGMAGTLSSVVDGERVLLLLWRHEMTRVFADRLTAPADRSWFSNALLSTTEAVLGTEARQMLDCEPSFVDFMRDAPEPTGEESDEADVELPRVYEPVFEATELRERLDMFLQQYNEMQRGSGMDLVFFPDAMRHLVSIARVIRHPRGNVLVVGVGGSGKQSLTRLATFIAGYRSFQIALTRSYNVANFLEDLKILYRTCGVQGKGTTFIFTELDIKEEVFLEYLNNILSSGVVSNLFSKDEQQEIISELTPALKRENQKRTLTNEIVMEHFMNRTCQNLHVVLCFSPVSAAFRSRAARFPALVAGCTVDWFEAWPRAALVEVAEHFLTPFALECTTQVKANLVAVLGAIQDEVATLSVEYFQRFRRSSHVTPKSYLNFIAGYKNIYQLKQRELGEGAQRMDTGLDKLKEAAEAVAGLKIELEATERELAAASARADAVLSEVTERARQAEIVKNQVQLVKEKAEALVAYIAEEKEKAEIKLEAAKPALEEAESALNTIKPAHIATVRKLGRPPHLIMRIMDCVLILFQRRLHPVIVDPAAPCPKPSWAESLKMMASTTFLLQLQNYPKDIINNEMVEHLTPYFEMEDYNMDTAKRVCGDVAGLLSWTKAMAFFHSVNREVLPLKANLLLQEARLKVAMDDLNGAERQLERRESALRGVRAQYEAALGERAQLAAQAAACLRKMNAATALVSGLAGERARWTQQSADFRRQLARLVGDAVLATGFLSYCGPYNQQFRARLMTTWTKVLSDKQIPLSEKLDVVTMLADSATVSEWTLQGLPNDELSVQNALIVTRSGSYPLLVDPQSQGKNWIKNKESTNELQITSLNHKYFRTHLEDSLSLGRPLLIEDVGIELDPVIDNVLEKNFIKSGSIEKVIVGDKECDVMPGFMLYITTKLPNPAYSPEISAKTAIIDFTVTMQGLEDQLLGRVILMEKADLEEERVALFESVMRNQRSMKELENDLLGRLSSSQGSLVDDEALIQVLQTTKTTAEEVNEKLKVAEVTEKKIGIAREEFRAVAARGSILYFLIVEMSNVNVMYQSSLKQFLTIFDGSIARAAKSSVPGERIELILGELTHAVWAWTLRGLYERHRVLFTLMLAMKIDWQRERLTHTEILTLVKGGASLDLHQVTPKPARWILDLAWLNLVELSKLPLFEHLLTKISSNEKEWRAWYETSRPEEEHLPGGYESILDAFRRLLLVRAWSPDRTLSQARRYIAESLGPEYGEGQLLDLDATWAESEPRTPLVCVLSVGADPSAQIASLARAKGLQLRAASMGQGQESAARQLISDGAAQGGWVLLQNTHLSLPFCSEAQDALLDADHLHESFRLWLTTEVHSEFPIGLLQMAIKFTNEPPQGVRASLRRSYQGVSQDMLDYSPLPQWPPLLYAVAFLHAVVQERRKFGPLGWNVPYEFNQADYAASVQFIQNHLDEIEPKKGVSWPTVCYMLGEVQYGGRVTDDFDKRLLNTFTAVWFSEALLRPGFEFHKQYGVPHSRTLSTAREHVANLPSHDSPEVFGLHPNADISHQINSAKDILDTILSVQPKEGATAGGETRETIVYKLAEDMLDKLPAQFISFEVKEALANMGAFLPMNIFLRQEIDRIQKVLHTVQSTLSELKLAIDGTIVMSQALRDSLDAMYDARVPNSWLRVSWESATLGFWYTELQERAKQFRTWLRGGRPNVFWMTGFFNPQGFLTAMRQEVTRAHRGWALDSVVLQNAVTRLNKEDVSESPAEGVLVHGLFLEGASLDRKTCKLVESKAKVLYEQMPVIHMFAINSTAGKEPRLYECPIYRKPQRTDAKYVGSIDFESDISPRHWTLRGVALLCDIK